ncbi:zinc transport system permease protein [Methanolinea mesophila]|uniref:metal ABC transporter permease n=1 Tax=Methanolinea mesophila TaxID=547055 RepID=UPI001AE9211C|nr:metal ABC transporter permease [Methanolinea mesophila]MBP1928104.1 zinc transport system permease protein [Methanolinea mesophila]
MFEILGYEFFRNALLAGLLASIACGIIGSYVVVKRMVALSGGISHAAFGGIGLGYYLGFDPILGAVGFALAVSTGIGILREKAVQNLDTLIGAVWAAGMALGILFISLTPGYAPDLFSYLFGNILLVPQGDLLLMGVLAMVIIGAVIIVYSPLLAVTFDEEYARVMNLPVTALMLLLLCLTALTVVMLIRVVGIILVIALLTLPAAIAREYAGEMKRMMVIAVAGGMIFTFSGIWLSYLFDIPSGATIILVSVAVYLAVLGERRLGLIGRNARSG